MPGASFTESCLMRTSVPRWCVGLVSFLTLTLVLLFLLVPGVMMPRAISIDTEDFGRLQVLAPRSDPKAFVVLLSDKDGLTGPISRYAENLVAAGAAVVPMSTRAIMAHLDDAKEKDGCNYLFGYLEKIARGAQRALGVARYSRPVLMGWGEGGTLAYLSGAQAPANTAAGAISIGFDAEFTSKRPFCAGAPFVATGVAFVYKPFHRLPQRWILVSDHALDTERAAFVAASPLAESRVAPGPDGIQFEVAAKAALEIGERDLSLVDSDPVADLPLIELPTKTPPKVLAVFYSGDGGWRDIDKSISEVLNQRDVAVIGVDSLRYFWRSQTPYAIAKDLDRIVAFYQAHWQVKRVALLGYSMGSGVIPFAWQKLASRTKTDTNLIVLLGLDQQSSFQISVSGLLDIAPSSADVDVAPALGSLPKPKVLCFYGTEERISKQTACLAAQLAGATLVERPGGHHFDGNYEAIATIILSALARAVKE